MSIPSAALTTGGPPGNTWVLSTITFQWARLVCSAPMPAAAPITADTTGTVFNSDTSMWVKLLASGRYVRPISSKLRTLPPAASSSRTYGSRHSSARCDALSSSPRPPPCPLPEPPRTVKSPAVTTTLRPSMRHIPSTLPCGVNDASSPCSS